MFNFISHQTQKHAEEDEDANLEIDDHDGRADEDSDECQRNVAEDFLVDDLVGDPIAEDFPPEKNIFRLRREVGVANDFLDELLGRQVLVAVLKLVIVKLDRRDFHLAGGLTANQFPVELEVRLELSAHGAEQKLRDVKLELHVAQLDLRDVDFVELVDEFTERFGPGLELRQDVRLVLNGGGHRDDFRHLQSVVESSHVDRRAEAAIRVEMPMVHRILEVIGRRRDEPDGIELLLHVEHPFDAEGGQRDGSEDDGSFAGLVEDQLRVKEVDESRHQSWFPPQLVLLVDDAWAAAVAVLRQPLLVQRQHRHEERHDVNVSHEDAKRGENAERLQARQDGGAAHEERDDVRQTCDGDRRASLFHHFPNPLRQLHVLQFAVDLPEGRRDDEHVINSKAHDDEEQRGVDRAVEEENRGQAATADVGHPDVHEPNRRELEAQFRPAELGQNEHHVNHH